MPGPRLFEPGPPIAFAEDFGRRFIVTIDTEEDFDWAAPFSRDGHSLASTPALAEGQGYFAGHGINPLYLVDYPITQDAPARDILGRAVAENAAEIGLQLHPWVTPPFDEAVNAFNSFAGNLPEALERAKLYTLYDAIVDAFGVKPQSYRAGRYGLGPRSMTLLAELGVACDTSVRAHFDYRAGGGPDYRHLPLKPYWTGPENAVAELPLTTIFAGMLRKHGERIFDSVPEGSRLRALLTRARAVERIPLTPEGTGPNDVKAAVAECAACDLPLLILSFHSPSLVPGNTPYVRDAVDLAAFYRWWDVAIDALDRHGYAPASLSRALAAITPIAPASPLAKRAAPPLSA